MAAIKRRCATCRFFQDSGMSGNGWCTHPDRQVSSDVRILVRKAELACRNAWGSDLWEAENADNAPAAQSPAPTPAQPPLPASPSAIVYDDEVTSVVNADQRSAQPSNLDDEVVEQSIKRFDDDAEYDYEQDERRDLLYRDSRSAIQRARQRHMSRNTPPSSVGPADDEDGLIHTQQDDPEATAARKTPAFEPDDFIEEETPSSTPVDEHDDTLISEGIQTPSPRSRRLRRFRDARTAPKEIMAAKNEPESDEVDLELPPSGASERGRFDSIPEISAEIDLPLLRRRSSAPGDALAEEPEADEAPMPPASSYDRALKRAHDTHHTSRIQHNKQRRDDAPVAVTATPSLADMPDLPETAPDDGPGTGNGFRAEAPSGTSAVLHPRPTAVRASDERDHSRKHQAARPRADEPLMPRPDARQSWWRGTPKATAADVDMRGGETNDVHEDYGTDTGYADARIDDITEPSAISFDLSKDEDLQSFRSRLFAATPGEDVGPVREAPAGRRSPISIARRERREFEEPARHREEERLHIRAERPEAPAQEARRPAGAEQLADAPRRAREVHVRLNEAMAQPRNAWYEPEEMGGFDVRALIEEDDEGLLDMTIEIAPEVPRVCGTCRNFRPGEQPGRGWCTNAWAFTHRQMVNDSDIACDSTIGCWWLPADEEVWLDEFDIAADATPRVDRLLARMHPERKAVGN